MIIQVCREVRNFFEVSVEKGDFSLQNGEIVLTVGYKLGQYILLTGSVLSNGIYKVVAIQNGVYTLDGAGTDEAWSGAVYGLGLPRDFVALCGEIEEFHAKDGNSNLVSESVLGVHSYTLATDGRGGRARWQDVFRRQLDPFRRMFTEVSV